MDLKSIRREYLKGGLRRDDLQVNPIDQFNKWMDQAQAMGLTDPTAMIAATVSANGQPSQRIVLLKQVDYQGFVFFTNYESRKGQDLQHNSKISLHFPWHNIERQIRICGVAEKISAAESRDYFSTRPRESQLAAWASAQSRPLSSKSVLIDQYNSMQQKYPDGEIPLPEFWGGYRVKPGEIEFWQGGAHRLHDRFVYSRADLETDQWSVVRLAP